MPSLKEYAAQNPAYRGRKCWFSYLSEREEAERFYADGGAQTTIFRWLLDECGHHDVTYSKVTRHLERRCGCWGA